MSMSEHRWAGVGNPRYTAYKRPFVDGPPIPDDEPYLVIRAQDILARDVLEGYIRSYDVQAPSTTPGRLEVMRELHEHLDRLRAWQLSHPPKWADR